ncbi:MAG TPA: MarR family transcriptional regulator [Nitrospirae bacterium]|nr:MarR family transcriptional regulator [Nitrospirota bacterium]
MSESVLRLTYPRSCRNERKWISNVLLKEFLGLDYVIEEKEGEISIESEGKELVLPDIFFRQVEGKWLANETLPLQPLQQWDTRDLGLDINLVSPVVPVIFGDGKIEVNSERIRLGIDIFGAAFFMLSRYEEAVKDSRDQFDRFPAAASLSYQEGFLDRPVVNEYLEIFWAAMKQLWPGLKRKKREPRTLVSCDVDVPYAWGTKGLIPLARQIGGDFICRKNPLLGVRSLLNYFYAKAGDYTFDHYYDKFIWMMDLNEKAGNRIAFYFISDQTDPEYDGRYSIDEPVIRELIRSINDRGHEIGFHASYNTYLDQKQTCLEVNKLKKVMSEIGVLQDVFGSRQHFLRWSTPVTAQNCEAAGIDYDTTLVFADHPGFRCGVCYEYPFYDVVERRELDLRERPLIVMEKSVFDKHYMGRSYGADGLKIFEKLKENCYRFGGDFTVLWHNNQFPNHKAMEIYKTIIQ